MLEKKLGLREAVNTILQRNRFLKKENIALQRHSEKIAEDGDKEIAELKKGAKNLVTALQTTKEKFVIQSEKIKQLEQDISNQDIEIRDLKDHLKDLSSKKQSQSEADKELQKQLNEAQEQLKKIEKENEEQKIYYKERVENLEINHERELEKQESLKVAQELTEALNKERSQNQELERELSQLCSANIELTDKLRVATSTGGKSLMEEMKEDKFTQTDTKHENKVSATVNSEKESINKPKQKIKKVPTFLEHPLLLYAISSPRR